MHSLPLLHLMAWEERSTVIFVASSPNALAEKNSWVIDVFCSLWGVLWSAIDFYFLQVGLNSLGIGCFLPTPLGHMPISNNINMNLCIHFTGCCITSLHLPQHRIYKGQLNVSKSSTVVTAQQTAPDSTPAASPLLATDGKNETGTGVQRVRAAGSTELFALALPERIQNVRRNHCTRYIPWIAASPKTQGNGISSHLRLKV